MSLTQYLKKELGITLTEASLVEKEVKNFTTILKESKLKKSKLKKFKEEEDVEIPVEEPIESPELDSEVESKEDIMDMDSTMIGDAYPDNEVEMIKIQLKSIVSNAESLMNTLDHEQNLDAWIQSKITLAQDYLNSAHDYIVYSDTYAEEGMDMDVDSEMEEPVVEEPVAEETPMEEPESLPAPEEAPEVKESFKYGFISF